MRIFSTRRRTEAAVMLLVFCVSRVLYYLAGVRFDASSLGFFMQFLDPVLLRTRLLESILYLHMQPPLFNMYLGVALKLFGRHAGSMSAVLFLLMGAGITLLLYFLMRELGAGALLSGALTLFFVASPACVVYENLLFYTYPLVLGVVAGAYLLHRYVETGCAGAGALFFAVLAAIALTRSLFHLVWMLTFLLLACAARPLRFRKWLPAALIPLLCVVAWYSKNAVIFGQFGSSSWMGMSMAQMTVEQLSAEQRETLLRKGLLSPLVNEHAYGAVRDYAPYLSPLTVPADVPALTELVKSNGWTNFNHIAYIPVSLQYQRASFQVIRHYPGVFLNSVGVSLLIYSMPATQFMDVFGNSMRVRRAERVFAILAGQVRGCPDPRQLSRMASGGPRVTSLSNVSWLWMAVLAAATCWGLYEGVRRFRSDPATAATLLYLAGNVIYVTVIGNILAMGENNRFRLMVDPLALVLAGVFVQQRLAKRRAPRAATSANL